MPVSEATALRRALLAWYRREARDLPWRRTKDPYRIWLSEIMLQQTRVGQGLPYYERFIAAFPTVNALAGATEDAVLKQWEGLGYYTRARNLHTAAKIIAHEGNGAFPYNAEGWRALPGVGRYTAGAIASIAFGERVPVLDGNVKRVLARLDDVAECIDDRDVETRLWERATELLPVSTPGDFNQGLMELGARICTPRRPQCNACPLSRFCVARARGVQTQRPVRRPKKPVPHFEIVVAAIRRNGRYLIGKRPPKGLLGGLWEFPGGKVQPGEDHERALIREIHEELGVAVQVGKRITTVSHAYSHFKVTLHVYHCDCGGAVPAARVHTDLKWIRPADFTRYAFPKANQKFLPLL